MPQRRYALILLMGLALITCAAAAQEAHPTPAENQDFRIYHIYLAGTPGKPFSIKASVEQIDKGRALKHWVEEWVRDQEGRVWGRVRAPREDHPGKLPPLTTVWLFDAAARKRTVCLAADRECHVDEYYSPYPISYLHVGGSSTVCIGGVCQVPEPQDRVSCADERLQQTFLGEYSIGGISLGHIRMMCYKPDGSGGGVDLWHNSEFDIDFDVYNMPLTEGATYYRIEQISSSVPDDPKLFQVPPSGYSVR
jgi:hypothetical protein